MQIRIQRPRYLPHSFMLRWTHLNFQLLSCLLIVSSSYRFEFNPSVGQQEDRRQLTLPISSSNPSQQPLSLLLLLFPRLEVDCCSCATKLGGTASPSPSSPRRISACLQGRRQFPGSVSFLELCNGVLAA